MKSTNNQTVSAMFAVHSFIIWNDGDSRTIATHHFITLADAVKFIDMMAEDYVNPKDPEVMADIIAGDINVKRYMDTRLRITFGGYQLLYYVTLNA